ncbi:MAG TPA: hypothetical protein VHG92_08365 [Afifellaceae bacterium]|nr:hypothetical protein [Afifellaceae bacterium]
MLAGVMLLLIVFYLGAVAATGRAWLEVSRGRARGKALRDLTGIASTAEIVRRFGLSDVDGRFRANFGQVLRHRTRAGLVLGDLPTQALLLAALAYAWLAPDGAFAAAATVAAAGHAALTIGVSLLLVASHPRTLTE